ncbi:glycosyltransferase [Pseudodesulfovibrio sp. JC047]|nr:glycosyltransferase [Pseudodesulfovibrio sp. JC047]
MSRPFFSIIIPIYNGSAFLRETIKSVEIQSFLDWEIIAIDDCSTDNSVQCVLDAKSENSKIRLFFHEESHGGPFAARNTALDHASGKYLIFLDQDDLLVEGALDHLAQLAKRCKSDAVRGVRLSLKKGREKNMNGFLPSSPITTQFREKPELWRGENFAAWIFNREFVLNNGLIFLDVIGHDDKVFLLQALTAARSLTISRIPLVKYRRRHTSLQGRKNSRSMLDNIRAHGKMMDILWETGNEKALAFRFDRIDFPAIAGMCAWASIHVNKVEQKVFFEQAAAILNRAEIRDLGPLRSEYHVLFVCLKERKSDSLLRLLQKYSHRLLPYPWWRVLWNKGLAVVNTRKK